MTTALSCAAGSFLLLFFAATSSLLLTRELAVADADKTRLSAELETLSRSSTAAPTTLDYTATLPLQAEFNPVLQHLQRLSVDVGVILGAVSVEPHAASESSLGHIDFSTQLRGAYGPIKTVIAETLDRHPSLILRAVSLQRNSASTELDARVDWMLLSRPQATPDKFPGNPR